MQKNRVVLDETVSRADVEGSAYSMQWQLVDQEPASASAPFRQIYRPADTAGHVVYVEDGVVALRYLDADAEAIPALRSIQAKLPARDAEHVLGLLRSARSADEARFALRHAALVAPPMFEADWYDAIRPWFDDPHNGVRLTAILVTAYLTWSEFSPILERLSALDSDIDVREDARVVLEGRRRGLHRE